MESGTEEATFPPLYFFETGFIYPWLFTMSQLQMRARVNADTGSDTSAFTYTVGTGLCGKNSIFESHEGHGVLALA